MGNIRSKLPKRMREAVEFFHKTELSELHATFDALCRVRTPTSDSGKKRTQHGIDRHTFSEYFNYPGVLREQIFRVFDVNRDGMIDRHEFLRGLAMCCRGPVDEKLRFCFDMFDLSGAGFIDREAPPIPATSSSPYLAELCFMRSLAESRASSTEARSWIFTPSINSIVKTRRVVVDHSIVGTRR